MQSSKSSECVTEQSKEVLAEEEKAKLANYRQRMEAIYLKYDPVKVSKVEKALELFKGYEEEVINQLVAHYGPEPHTMQEEKSSSEQLLETDKDDNLSNNGGDALSDEEFENCVSVPMTQTAAITEQNIPLHEISNKSEQLLSEENEPQNTHASEQINVEQQYFTSSSTTTPMLLAECTALTHSILLRGRYWHKWMRFHLIHEQQECEQKSILHELISAVQHCAKDVKIIAQINELTMQNDEENVNDMQGVNRSIGRDDKTMINREMCYGEIDNFVVLEQNAVNCSTVEEPQKERKCVNLFVKCKELNLSTSSLSQVVDCTVTLLNEMHVGLRDALLAAHELHDTKKYVDALEAQIEEIEPFVEKYHEAEANIAEALHVNKILQQELETYCHNSSSSNNDDKSKCVINNEENHIGTSDKNSSSSPSSSSHSFVAVERNANKTSNLFQNSQTTPHKDKNRAKANNERRLHRSLLEQKQSTPLHHARENKLYGVASKSHTRFLPKRATFSEPLLYLHQQHQQRELNNKTPLRSFAKCIETTPVKQEEYFQSTASAHKHNSPDAGLTREVHQNESLTPLHKYNDNNNNNNYYIDECDVERGECPMCKCKLISCYPARYGAAHEKAAFCLECRRAFTFAELATRDGQEQL